jgi:hypothetical protein
LIGEQHVVNHADDVPFRLLERTPETTRRNVVVQTGREASSGMQPVSILPACLAG